MIALSIPEGIPRPTIRAFQDGRGMIALSVALSIALRIPEGILERIPEGIARPTTSRAQRRAAE
jgi:hypothetical protein